MLGETVCKPMDAPPITTVWVVRFTKIFFYLCALMMLLVGLAGALEVDVTIKPKFMPYYWHYFAEVGLLPSLEVGVAVSPQVTVLGKITGYYYAIPFTYKTRKKRMEKAMLKRS